MVNCGGGVIELTLINGGATNCDCKVGGCKDGCKGGCKGGCCSYGCRYGN